MKLLVCTGYDNLKSLSKLANEQYVKELEEYATDNLDASDLGLSDGDKRYYFNQRTKKFSILPGHRHLIVCASEIAERVLLQQSDNEVNIQIENASADDIDISSVDTDDKNSTHGDQSSISEDFKPLVNAAGASVVANSVEEEVRLVEFLKTWIARKVLLGFLDSFNYDIDYKIQVYRPKASNHAPRSDGVYSFVCLHCNTTIRIFRRQNGQSWNAANVCRHISTVHYKTPIKIKRSSSNNNRKQSLHHHRPSSTYYTPPMSDSPISDPLD